MLSTTLLLQPATMASKSLTPSAYDIRRPVQEKTEVRSVRMSWVVVTDATGNRRLQMHWWAK